MRAHAFSREIDLLEMAHAILAARATRRCRERHEMRGTGRG